MLKNNLLLAIKILQRRKFYTFISLFCISLTLMVLIVVTSLIDSFIHPIGPERNSDFFLNANKMALAINFDQFGEGKMMSALPYGFVENYVLPMETPTLISAFTAGTLESIGFKNGIKVSSGLKRTDANYWKILAFDFLQGRPINETEHQQGSFVAVISETTKGYYFPDETAVGKSLVLDGLSYLVIGVVKDVPPQQIEASADIWVPIFATPSTEFRNSEADRMFAVMLMGSSTQALVAIKEEYQTVMKNYPGVVPPGIPPGEVTAFSYANTKVEELVRQVDSALGNSEALFEQSTNSGNKKVLMLVPLAMILFMILPVINLININISRIMERSSEIGVRKSFGASSAHLVKQFMVENLVITIIGGALGFILANVALYLLTLTVWFPENSFSFSYRIFFMGSLYILVFSFFSGVLPAWKMSRLDPVQALKGAVS